MPADFLACTLLYLHMAEVVISSWNLLFWHKYYLLRGLCLHPSSPNYSPKALPFTTPTMILTCDLGVSQENKCSGHSIKLTESVGLYLLPLFPWIPFSTLSSSSSSIGKNINFLLFDLKPSIIPVSNSAVKNMQPAFLAQSLFSASLLLLSASVEVLNF